MIRSPAGEFEISIERFDVENDKLVMVGQMGVWDARTYIEPHEVWGVLGKLLRPAAFNFLLRSLFRFTRTRPRSDA